MHFLANYVYVRNWRRSNLLWCIFWKTWKVSTNVLWYILIYYWQMKRPFVPRSAPALLPIPHTQGGMEGDTGARTWAALAASGRSLTALPVQLRAVPLEGTKNLGLFADGRLLNERTHFTNAREVNIWTNSFSFRPPESGRWARRCRGRLLWAGGEGKEAAGEKQ